MSALARSTFVIARRDFMSIVATPTFLLFLLAPLFMIGFGAVGGLGASRVATSAADKARLVVIATAEDRDRLQAVDRRLRKLFRPGDGPPPVEFRRVSGDPATEAAAAFADPALEVLAVMHGPIAAPVIVHDPRGARSARYLAALAEQTVRDARAGSPPPLELSQPAISERTRSAPTASGQQSAGFSAVFVIFLLTLLLAGQSVGMLAEEKGNKVIEILAAAARLEAVFLGKLVGLFGVALLFVAFWGGLGTLALLFAPGRDALLAGFQPAIGMPLFLIFGALYFTMAYMLLGAIFLGVGAQAATMREIQMLSLPITVFQVAMFGLSTAAAGDPGSTVARFAEWFPFSSPFAMAARGATDPAVVPHVLALGWQALWVAITIWAAARLFRTGVLKSGGGLRFGWSRRMQRTAE